MKTYTIKTEREVRAEQIEDLLSTAFSAITYWCNGVEVDEENKPTEEYIWKSDVLTRGGNLKIYIIDEEEIKVLTLEKLLKALGDTLIDFDDYDAVDADKVIQYALFGEVVYA